jgi:hypothetical protein
VPKLSICTIGDIVLGGNGFLQYWYWHDYRIA